MPEGSVHRKHGIGEHIGIEWLQVFDLFAQAQKANWVVQLGVDGDHDAAFAATIELGKAEAIERRVLGERTSLCQGVGPSRTVDDQPGVMR